MKLALFIPSLTVVQVNQRNKDYKLLLIFLRRLVRSLPHPIKHLWVLLHSSDKIQEDATVFLGMLVCIGVRAVLAISFNTLAFRQIRIS